MFVLLHCQKQPLGWAIPGPTSVGGEATLLNQLMSCVSPHQLRRGYKSSWEGNLAPDTQKDETNFNLKMALHETKRRLIPSGSTASRQLTKTHRKTLWKSFTNWKKHVFVVKSIFEKAQAHSWLAHTAFKWTFCTLDRRQRCPHPLCSPRSFKGFLKKEV